MKKNSGRNFYYDLSGGINLIKTKIGLGADVKRLFWDDSFNVETLKNQGVCSQKGNSLLFELEDDDGIIGICEYPKNTDSFVFVCSSGKIYHYSGASGTFSLKNTLMVAPSCVNFAHFIDGLVIATPENEGLFFKLGAVTEFCPLNLVNSDNEPIMSTAIAVFASRVWLSKGSVLYFSALGKFSDWTTAQDAGYIAKFHSSTSEIVAMKEYKGCLAIYKPDGVYLLSGNNPDDFSISRFADLGANSCGSVISENNKQYFINDEGVFALEQTGELAQIALSSNIALNIQPYFSESDLKNSPRIQVVSYKSKNQIWFFPKLFSTSLENGTQTNANCEVWIYDYFIRAWFKRIIPYQITAVATVLGKIYSASADGKIFVENVGNTFSGKTIDFRFSTPFFHLGAPNCRKIIENLSFIFDEGSENAFKLSVCKDYIKSELTDIDFVDTLTPRTLVFVESEHSTDRFASCWNTFSWAEPFEEAYKADVFDSNTSVQLNIESSKFGDEFALVGIEFKEVLEDE